MKNIWYLFYSRNTSFIIKHVILVSTVSQSTDKTLQNKVLYRCSLPPHRSINQKDRLLYQLNWFLVYSYTIHSHILAERKRTKYSFAWKISLSYFVSFWKSFTDKMKSVFDRTNKLKWIFGSSFLFSFCCYF